MNNVNVYFREPVLVVANVEDYGEYSANPGDYFYVGDDHVFKDRELVCTVILENWQRHVILKENPTKADLENWLELAHENELSIIESMLNIARKAVYEATGVSYQRVQGEVKE